MGVNIHFPKEVKDRNPLLKGLKGGNSIYLFIQRRLLNYCNHRKFLKRADILYCISRHFQFSQGLVNAIIIDLKKHKLLKKVNRDIYQLINLEKSKGLEQILNNLKEVKVRRGQ